MTILHIVLLENLFCILKVRIFFVKCDNFSAIWFCFCTYLIPFPFEQHLIIYSSAVQPQVLIQMLLVRQKVCRLLAVRQKEERARLAVTVGTGAACQKLLPMHCIAPTSSREAGAFQGTHDLGKTEDKEIKNLSETTSARLKTLDVHNGDSAPAMQKHKNDFALFSAQYIA